MPKQVQRQKQRDRRARREHGLRLEATRASRRHQRLVRVAVGLVAALGILFLGVLGTTVRQETAQERPRGSTTTAPPAPAAVDAEPEPPPCPAEDGTSPRRTQFDRAPEMCIDPAGRYQATFVTSAGSFVADLFADRSPLAVNNFVFLARYHFYDDLPFHRVAQGLFAQTGDPLSPELVGPGYTYEDDPLPQPGEYGVGTMVVAHERPDDNGSQFLIWLGPQAAELDPILPLFGQVVRGLDVLEEIGADGGTTQNPKPTTVHTIQRIEILEP